MMGPMRQSDDALALLGRSRLFKKADPAELASLLKEARWRRYPSDSYVFREEDPADHLLIIASGQVKISRSTEGGSEVVFAILGPGDALGELGALEEGATRSADAKALVDTECLIIHRPALVSFLNSHSMAMWGVVNVLTSYIRTKDEAFADLAVRDIPGRVARKLLDLAAPAEPGRESTLQLSQSTLAGLVGASRENVNRTLSRFASLGYISLDRRGRITLLRPDELRRRGE
jgi:CRP/FNR family transcriptional regulator, cyclic AMP receptor protein